MVRIYTAILGNSSSELWRERLKGCEIEYLDLDQWSAQKSRQMVKGSLGGSYAIAMNRHSQLVDGDILYYNSSERRAVVVRIAQCDVMVIDLVEIEGMEWQKRVQLIFELGHAIGNQHWPAVVHGLKVYVPLTVDKKVMSSVMNTHNIEGVKFEFQRSEMVVPYLLPHEIRRLFAMSDYGVQGDKSGEHHSTSHHH